VLNSGNVNTWDALTSCGGTKWCCSDVDGCCSKPNLVFDIGVPAVINNYGASDTTGTLSSQPTTGGIATVITAAATDSSTATATGAVTTEMPSESSSTKTGVASTSHKSIIIGIAAAVIAFFVLALLAGVVVFCIVKKKKSKQAAPVNLMDLTSPVGPQQVYTGSTAQLVSNHGQYGHEKTDFEPAPAYTPPSYQQPPIGPNGQAMFELQSPPVKQPVYHELG
jgi:hypothetical protein